MSNYTVLTLFFTSLLGILIAHKTPNAATLCGGSITLCAAFCNRGLFLCGTLCHEHRLFR
ncbi:MAG: hypothetical protein V8S57_06405 [Oscillospiraceae bacterium]